MNAKKIMGAVLVALLAAALFVGAGAAAGTGEVVFVYQQMDGTQYNGTWTNAAGNSIEFVTVNTAGNTSIVGANIVEGKYTQGSGNNEKSIVVKYATGSIIGYGNYQSTNYSVIGETYYKVPSSTLVLENVSASTTVDVEGIVVIGSDNVAKPYASMTDAANNMTSGTYKLQVYFNASTAGFITTVPTDFAGIVLGKDVFTITVKDGADATVTAAADSVIAENTVDITIAGLPGVSYTITSDGFTIPAQAAITTGNSVTMPNTGKVTITLKAGTTTGDYTITVVPPNGLGDEAEVSLEIVAGAITAVAEQESYYIGNDVTITGTSTAGTELHAYIAGTNLKFQELNKTTGGSSNNDISVKNGEFEYEITGDVFKKFDAGTYTVYIAVADGKTSVEQLGDNYGTAALVLKQPFISVTEAPSVAVQGSPYTVKGTAEAATGVYAYIFGTNFFAANKTGDDVFATIQVKDNEFTIKVKGSATKNMSAGQYFMVVQHPMYDTYFNIAANETTKIVLNETADASIYGGAVLFDVKDRQRANAAEALCQALDTENIDDMYVKLSFVVAAPQSVINPIPETVAQGEKLTISGSTNMGEGTIVTVEMLSTAFAAVPKSTVGSASFISLVTKTDKDGNWEVTFDTSGLNVDEYTVSAAVEQLGTATAKVNVVEAAPEQPDQPDVPGDEPEQPGDKPEAPATPGFGALAALAGLGAVAVLLLRRE